MSSYKELLNDLSRKTSALRQLTDEEEKALKKLLTEMLQDIISICDANELTWMMGGGSCVGTIRHQGFIPWDDDLDLNMPRGDAEKLKGLLKEGALGNDYEYTCPNSGKDAPCMFLKIYKKGTRMVELGQESSSYPHGVFIDIFILDGAPGYKWMRKLKGCVANMLRLVANVVMEAKSFQSETQKEFFHSDKRAALIMNLRRIMGHVFGVFSHKFWIDTFDSFVKNEDTDDGWVTFPTGRKLYEGESLPSSVFFPVKKAIFEGVEVNVPGRVEDYLTNLYGKNYMQLPPVEKRERHFIVEFCLNTNWSNDT